MAGVLAMESVSGKPRRKTSYRILSMKLKTFEIVARNTRRGVAVMTKRQEGHEVGVAWRGQ